jgi:uncharacterized membrane protein
VVPTTTKGFTTNTSLVVSTIYTIFDTSANNSKHHLQPIRASTTLAI